MTDTAFKYLVTPREVRSTVKYSYEETLNHKAEVFKKAFNRDFKPTRKSLLVRLFELICK